MYALDTRYGLFFLFFSTFLRNFANKNYIHYV